MKEPVLSGPVTKHLAQLIAKQVEDKGLVVWYDPERAYAAAAAELGLPDTTFARYDGSFIALRKAIDDRLNDTHPPRLVVYVPMDRTETHSALIELDCAGVVMQPRQQPPACNTRLSVVARNALKPILGEEQVGEIERQVESGKLSLADLNALAEQGIDISTGVLKLIFGSANPQDVALAFLHTDRHDNEVDKKSAQKELRHLLHLGFDIALPAAEPLSNLRVRFARHLLLTDLFAALKTQIPDALASVSVAESPGGIDACVRLAHTWRNSREHRDSYVDLANRVEEELGLGQMVWPPELLERNETFLCVERTLLAQVESGLFKTASPVWRALATSRLSCFWADVVPAIQARWALVASAADVLLAADRVAGALKTAPDGVANLVKAYTEGDDPWCLLDTHHRHLESRKYNFEFAVSGDHQGLEKLIIRAEQRYTAVGSELARQFISQFHKAQHPIKGVLRQRDCFETQVKPHLGTGKLAYLWVDALRFEMARELARLLTDDFELELRPAIGTLPTITETGMAALLPKAHESAKVVSVGGGKLALEIAGTVIKNRKDRVAFLKEHACVSVFDAKLDDLLPKPSKKIKEGIQNAHLILITSQEIDDLGEADNMTQARLQIDGILSHLRRGVRVLADHGIETIVMAADHGHLFADEIGDDMKIESPGGNIHDLHRRVWVGIGGTSEPSYLRTSLTSLGVESEFDIAIPWTFAVFKAKGGGRAYFHGGLSPQEVIVPVAVMKPRAKAAASSTGMDWTLTPGTTKLTTRFFSVQITGAQGQASLFGFEPPKVRIELRANKKCVSLAVSASYGFQDATGEVTLKVADNDTKQTEPNTVTLMLTEEIAQKTVSLYLLDAITGAELTPPMTIDVAISI
ncbi:MULTISPECIES: PglZ domain-containing protein [unclassified Thiocapsa]|uniref:PglZ domain-containing protein n=1 Tax=unclassified Thiocapsa TaxID=2641286 RepID=UPI0035AFC100